MKFGGTASEGVALLTPPAGRLILGMKTSENRFFRSLMLGCQAR
jgi:hypothetical protein